MKILLVEDDVKIAGALKKGLSQDNFIVSYAGDSDAAVIEVENDDYDAVILDIMLPGSMDGVGVLRHMRDNGDMTPVLMLTAKGTTANRVEGLNAGADDYLPKPFAYEELLARLRALLRRPHEARDVQLQYNGVCLDRATGLFVRDGTSIQLSPREVSLLEYLMTHPGRVCSKQELRDHSWDFDADILPNTVEKFIASLRQKIDKPFPNRQLIHTSRGFGYRFGDQDV